MKYLNRADMARQPTWRDYAAPIIHEVLTETAGKPATLCITSLTDGGDKVHGSGGAVTQPVKYKFAR